MEIVPQHRHGIRLRELRQQSLGPYELIIKAVNEPSIGSVGTTARVQTAYMGDAIARGVHAREPLIDVIALSSGLTADGKRLCLQAFRARWARQQPTSLG